MLLVLIDRYMGSQAAKALPCASRLSRKNNCLICYAHTEEEKNGLGKISFRRRDKKV